MDLLRKLLLVLSIWECVRISANGCSVFPFGSPSCFPDAPDASESNEKIKEILYKPAAGMNSYDINKNFVMLFRLGDIYTETLGGSEDVVECQRNLTEGAYVNDFETKCYNNGKNGNDVVDEILKKVTDFFVITKKEVWNCQNEQNNITFTRVVTELFAKSELVKSISAPDGISVTTVPIVRYGDGGQGNKKAVVREVKYLNPETKKPLRYDGFLVLHKPKNVKDEDLSIFKPLSGGGLQSDDGTGDFFREVIYNSYKNSINTQLLFDDPSKDLVLWDQGKVIGKVEGTRKNPKAECRINTEDKYLYFDSIFPPWSITIQVKRIDMELAAPASASNVKGYFSVTKQESWICKIENSNEEFGRRVSEYIGNKPVETIKFHDGSKVWQFALDDSSKSVGIRTVVYYKADDPFKALSYEGEIKLLKDPAPVKDKAKTKKLGFISNFIPKKKTS